ncbi:response regulator [Candidatus Microgenomates bacterium]|nr:response regulator [Candidatus Microgenomates bacterium]
MTNEKGSILILDDDPIWREALGAFFADRGFIVQLAASYEEAVLALRAELFHVVIADLRLKDWNPEDRSGIELLRYIAQSGLEVPNCIILTGFPTISVMRDAFRNYKIWDFIDKSHDIDEILRIVEEAAKDAASKTNKMPASLKEKWDTLIQNIINIEANTFSDLVTQMAVEIAQLLDLPEPLPGVVYGRLVAVLQDMVPIFSHIGFTPQIPIFFLKDFHLLESDLDDLRYLLMHRLGPSMRVAFLILFGQKEDIRAAHILLNEKLRRPYAYDIFALGQEDVQRIIATRDPHRMLRRILLSEINLTTVSPFVTSAPVPSKMFFGREPELREIVEHAAAANYALIGGRRIGKTSILYQLHFIHLPAAGFQSFYQDCSITSGHETFIDTVVRAWLHKASDESDFFRIPAETPRSFAALVDRLSKEEATVVLLDEVDKLILADRINGYPLFTEFRALAQRGRCQFVLAGERVLREALSDPTGPLFNFANEIFVGRLDFRAVEALITQPMKQLEIELVNEAAIVHSIYDFTSGHPNVTQRLCQRLIIRLNEQQERRIMLDDIKGIAADPDFLRRDFLDTYWERASVLEKLVSLVMVKHSTARTLTNIRLALTREGIEVSLNSVDDALERLVDLRNILKRTPIGYDFAVTAFPHVVSQSQRLGDLIALNYETYQTKGDIVVVDHHIPEEL